MAVNKLNKTFISNQILTAQEMNQITSKIDKLVDGVNTNASNIPDISQLATAKQHKIDEITVYDTSKAVNSFTLDGEQVWLDKDTRVGLMNSTNIQKSAGQETTTLWFEGKSYTIPCDTAIQMLSALELYALECYNVTAQHKANVEALTTKKEVEAYDYTTGYPEKLTFDTMV